MIASCSSGFSLAKRALVALQRFRVDGVLERRHAIIRFPTIQVGQIGPPPPAPQLVANPVEDGLPEVRVQRPDASNLEVVNPLERLEERLLDDIVGVGQIAG